MDIVVKINGYDVDRDWLIEKYETEHLSCAEIGKLLGCSRMTVSRLLKRFGISSRPFGHGRQRLTREEALKALLDTYDVEALLPYLGNQT